jgi:hypothetical protein
MPGVILYRECKTRLESIRREHSEIFDKYSLYVDVQRILESYNFKLTARREILALFSEKARLKSIVTNRSTNTLTANATVKIGLVVDSSTPLSHTDASQTRAYTPEQ